MGGFKYKNFDDFSAPVVERRAGALTDLHSRLSSQRNMLKKEKLSCYLWWLESEKITSVLF